MEKQVIKIFSAIMNISADQVKLDDSQKSIEQWDSLKHINLILSLEQEFGVSFLDEDINACRSIQQIIEVLEKKMG